MFPSLVQQYLAIMLSQQGPTSGTSAAQSQIKSVNSTVRSERISVGPVLYWDVHYASLWSRFCFTNVGVAEVFILYNAQTSNSMASTDSLTVILYFVQVLTTMCHEKPMRHAISKCTRSESSVTEFLTLNNLGEQSLPSQTDVRI